MRCVRTYVPSIHPFTPLSARPALKIMGRKKMAMPCLSKKKRIIHSKTTKVNQKISKPSKSCRGKNNTKNGSNFPAEKINSDFHFNSNSVLIVDFASPNIQLQHEKTSACKHKMLQREESPQSGKLCEHFSHSTIRGPLHSHSQHIHSFCFSKNASE